MPGTANVQTYNFKHVSKRRARRPYGRLRPAFKITAHQTDLSINLSIHAMLPFSITVRS